MLDRDCIKSVIAYRLASQGYRNISAAHGPEERFGDFIVSYETPDEEYHEAKILVGSIDHEDGDPDLNDILKGTGWVAKQA